MIVVSSSGFSIEMIKIVSISCSHFDCARCQFEWFFDWNDKNCIEKLFTSITLVEKFSRYASLNSKLLNSKLLNLKLFKKNHFN